VIRLLREPSFFLLTTPGTGIIFGINQEETVMDKLVRRFSAIGPCLTEGRFVKETAKFVVFEEWHGGDRYSGIKRIAKGRVHTEPCRCCRDHSETMYPNGYMD
jgi:hypothetical protein